MKLSVKVGLSFAIALTVNIVVLYFGLVGILDAVSGKLMRKQAEDITVLVKHEIMDAATISGTFDPGLTKRSFERVKHVSTEGGSFEISKILLIDQNLIVVASYPESETGLDYSAHADIRESLDNKSHLVAEEAPSVQMGILRREIDVVSYFEMVPGTGYTLEVKLDFAKSTALLEKQYAYIETAAIVVALLLLTGLLGVLLAIVSRSAVRPVSEITRAMERVGSGDLDVSLSRTGNDEFGLMAARFNEMVRGLKERLQLSQYVSRSTVEAVRVSVGSHSSGHTARRRRCTLFFSDIRGFTTYSESRDPAKVVEILNLILSVQADIIKGAGGDVDKFVGDEVMAVFSESLPALEAAFEIQKAMASRRDEFDRLGIGIGIHEGEVVECDVGSQDVRNFTVIGDVVNTAARLESQARSGEILVSGVVAEHKVSRDRFAFEARGELKLKGKEISIHTFSVRGRKRAGEASIDQ